MRVERLSDVLVTSEHFAHPSHAPSTVLFYLLQLGICALKPFFKHDIIHLCLSRCRTYNSPKLVLAPDVCGAVLGVGDLDGHDGPRFGGVVVVVGVADRDQIWGGIRRN